MEEDLKISQNINPTNEKQKVMLPRLRINYNFGKFNDISQEVVDRTEKIKQELQELKGKYTDIGEFGKVFNQFEPALQYHIVKTLTSTPAQNLGASDELYTLVFPQGDLNGSSNEAVANWAPEITMDGRNLMLVNGKEPDLPPGLTSQDIQNSLLEKNGDSLEMSSKVFLALNAKRYLTNMGLGIDPSILTTDAMDRANRLHLKINNSGDLYWLLNYGFEARPVSKVVGEFIMNENLESVPVAEKIGN